MKESPGQCCLAIRAIESWYRRAQQVCGRDDAFYCTGLDFPNECVAIGVDRVKRLIEPFVYAVLGVEDDEPLPPVPLRRFQGRNDIRGHHAAIRAAAVRFDPELSVLLLEPARRCCRVFRESRGGVRPRTAAPRQPRRRGREVRPRYEGGYSERSLMLSTTRASARPARRDCAMM